MTTKEQLLKLFEENKGKYFSGEDIGRALDISRTAVWKTVKSLTEEGYKIDAVRNKGYCLSTGSDKVSAIGVKKYLSDKSIKTEVMNTVTSTNTVLKERAQQGEEDGFVLIANSQTKGRGRMGRSFFSPDSSGLYMSILLRPRGWKSTKAFRITTMAAVAMCEAINSFGEEEAAVKWVNDIFVKGRKVCGILTEASFDLETAELSYAVLGIGINVYEPDNGFPEDIKDTAGAVFSEKGDDRKNRLAAAFLDRFFYYYKSEDYREYTEKYRKMSLALGKEVTVLTGDKKEKAFVEDIDDECRLKLKFPDGQEKTLSYGEIAIKL